MTQDKSVRSLQLDISKHQRRHAMIARHLAKVVYTSEVRQNIIDSRDRKLLGIYKLVTLDERKPRERLAVIQQIIEETCPQRVAEFRKARGLDGL